MVLVFFSTHSDVSLVWPLTITVTITPLGEWKSLVAGSVAQSILCDSILPYSPEGPQSSRNCEKVYLSYWLGCCFHSGSAL